MRVNKASREYKVLIELMQELPNAQGREIFLAIERAFLLAFNLGAAVIVPGPDAHGDGAEMKVLSSSFQLSAQDREAAMTAMRELCMAGYGTDIAENADFLFVPLYVCSKLVGVLGLKSDPRLPALACPGSAAFRAVRNQAALSILRVTLEQQAQTARVLQDTDRLQKALLSSISHNVRTPIASILGSLTTLREPSATLDEATRQDLIDNALTETERLNRLLGNLLDLGRLEAGALRVRLDPCDVQDVIGAAIEQLGAGVQNRGLRIAMPPDLPFVRMDFVLIVQVLVNLLDNALKYSPPNEEIVVEAAVLEDRLEVRVLDLGDGIPEHELKNVFEKFNRAGRSGERGGVGLGLSICKGLVEAHHGRIQAERRRPRGTAVGFTIPFDGGGR